MKAATSWLSPVAIAVLLLLQIPAKAQTTAYQEYEVERKPILENQDLLNAEISLPTTLAANLTDTRVVFRVLVNDQGGYEKHVMVESPDSQLTQACAAVLPKAKFQPAVRLNSYVNCWTNVSFRFQFNDQGKRISEATAQNLGYVRQKIGYPQIAKQSGIMGKVVVQVLVTTQGLVSDYKVLASPDVVLTESVVRALPDLRFTPATASGQPIESWLEIPFEFQLVGAYREYEFKPQTAKPVKPSKAERKAARRGDKGKIVVEKAPTKKQLRKAQKRKLKQQKREEKEKRKMESAKQLRKAEKRSRKQDKREEKARKRGQIRLPPISTVEVLDQAPELLNAKKLLRKLEYPKLAKIAGRSGTVIYGLYVYPKKKPKRKEPSNVLAAQVVQSPELDFTIASYKAVKRARFSNALKGGEPVASWVHLIIHFQAEGGNLLHPTRKKWFLFLKKKVKQKPILQIQVSSAHRAPYYQ